MKTNFLLLAVIFNLSVAWTQNTVNADTGDAYILFGPNSNWGEYFQVGGNGRVTSNAGVFATNGNLHIDSKNSSFRTYINHYSQGNTILNSQGGKVGIGTTTPTELLELSEDTNGPVYLGVYNNNLGSGSQAGIKFGIGTNYDKGTNLYFQRSNNTFYLSNTGDHNSNFLFRTRNSSGTFIDALKINPGGNIGIGTISPGSKLHVEGRTRIGKNGTLHLDWTNESNWGGNAGKWAGHIGFNAYRNNDDDKDHYYGSNTYTSKGVIEGSNHGFRWLFRSPNNNDSNGQHLLSEYMRLTNSGDLGIGTTTPDAKLTVKGDIHAQEVKVDLDGAVAPDYVFYEDYNLRPLKEVQEYIHENGHLPNIPSAKEMEERGLLLKEMNLKLLEKIEELTLYVIELEKKNKKYEERFAKIESELKIKK